MDMEAAGSWTALPNRRWIALLIAAKLPSGNACRLSSSRCTGWPANIMREYAKCKMRHCVCSHSHIPRW